MKYFFSLMREYIFPSGCAICDGMLLDKREVWLGLCGNCQNTFILEKEIRCSQCGRPLISELDTCLECRNKETHYLDKLVSLFPYIGNYEKLLKSYKFEKHLAVGNFLVEKMQEGLNLFSACTFENPVLVPVPPRAGKIKHSGWDQIDYLANLIKKENKSFFPMRKCLKRLPSKSQKELNKEKRKTNLFGRIKVVGKVPKEVILFDDVITTGSTLETCAVTLKNAGAEKVYGFCFFYK